MNVNKSSYLYWLNIESKNISNTIAFYHEIIKIYSESNGLYGAPKITAILNNNNLIDNDGKFINVLDFYSNQAEYTPMYS